MVLLGVWTTALGVMPESRAESAPGAIEEIVVTAQKRDQSLQDVPIAITAMTQAELERRRIRNPLDVAAKTPGVVGSVQAGVPAFNIRGIGTNDFGSAADPAVGVYLDGVYTARTVASLIGLYDAERVEVIKGPQGTLFGRSAAAGAISVISRKPDEVSSFSAAVEYGNYDNIRLTGSLNLPLSDSAFLRVSALSHQRDGYVINTADGTDLNNVDDKGVRAALRFLPTDALDITVSGDYLRSDNNGVGLKSATIPFEGDDGSPFGDVRHDLTDPISDLRNFGGALHVAADLGAQLSLTSITAYREYEFTILEDDDGSFVELLVTGTLPEKSKTFSQELRLNGAWGSRGSWMVGASYFHEDISTDGIARSNLDVLFGPGSGGSFAERSYSSGDYDSYSVYADTTIPLAERVDLIAGLRWTLDEKRFRLFVPPNPDIGVNLLFGGVDPEARLSEDWTSWQPRLVLQFYPSDEIMTYLSASRGYKPGGFGSFELQPPFDPEFVWSYEAGLKSRFADGRVQLNAAVFYYDYQDLQVTTQVGLALQTTNASEASGSGVELDAIWSPFADFRLQAGVAYLDAKYDEFLQGELDPITFVPVTIDRSGNRLTRAPKWQYNLGADYGHSLGGAGRLDLSAAYVYQSRVYFHAANDDFRSQDGYGLLEARATYTALSDKWSLSIFGENLLDENYLIDAGGLAEVLMSPITLAGLPRTYGLEMSIRF